jgi:hypothetical protein
MVALSPTLIYYSNQAKQYSLEVLVALTLVGLTFPCLGEHRNRRAETFLLVAGILGVWVSGSAVFVLCAIVAGLLLQSVTSPHPGWKLPVTLVVAWAGSFLGAYGLIYRAASMGTYKQHFWSAAFLGGSASEFPDRFRTIMEQTIWGLLVGVPSPVWGSRAPMLYLILTGATVGAAGLGIAGMARGNGRSALALTLGPLAAVGGASLLRAYPLVPRLLLFAAPLIYLLVASGVEWAVRALPGAMQSRIRWGTVALILIPSTWLSMLQATAKDPPAHLRPLLDVLRERRVGGEPVYVFAPSIPPWAFYSTDWSSPDTARLSFLERIAGSGGPSFENATGRGHPVAGEGEGLVYESKAGKEIYGVFTGIEWTPLRGVRKRDPDPGWACNEADRIRAAASPAIWVLMSHLVGSENELLQELERRGGRRTYARTRNYGLLLRFEFPAAGRPD